MIKFLLIPISLLIGGCSVSETTHYYGGNISISLENNPKICPDSVFSSVTYIPLETSEQSLVGEIDKIQLVDNVFYILDKQQNTILLFNSKGIFLRKLSKMGGGPGEYVSIEDFFVKNEQLYVLSSANQKIVVYDRSLKFVRELLIDTYAANLICTNTDIYIYTNFFSVDLKNVFVFDLQSGKLKNKYADFGREQLGVGYRRTVFSTDSESIFMFYPYDYSIYRLTENTESVWMKIDFGSENMYPSEFGKYTEKEKKDFIKAKYNSLYDRPIAGINNLSVTDSLLFFTFVHKCIPSYYFLNRINNKARYGSMDVTNSFPFANTGFLFVNGSYFLTHIQPEFIHAYLEYNSKEDYADPIAKFANKLKMDDNPVLCIYKFKQ